MRATFAFYVSNQPGKGRRLVRIEVNGLPRSLYIRVVPTNAQTDLEALDEAAPPERNEQFMNTHSFEFKE